MSVAGRSTNAPFAATSHPLSVGLLRPPTLGEARELGAACAAMDPWLTLGYQAVALEAYLDRPDTSLHRFAILWDGRAAGVLTLRFPWLRGPFIEMLAVLPAHRGRGLARSALSWATARAASVATNVWATVSDFHEPARAFWKHEGFEEIAELPGLIGEGSEILLRKRLPPKT